MSSYVIRNMPPELFAAVKREAAARGTKSRNYILEAITCAVDSDREVRESDARVDAMFPASTGVSAAIKRGDLGPMVEHIR